MFNEDDFKGTPINICYVKSDYLKYIRKFDVSVK